jgi:chemotaxis protein histidine kinase CheA
MASREGEGQEEYADVLQVLDSLDQLRDQLSSIQRGPPKFEMRSEEEEEVPVLASKAIAAARAAAADDDEEEEEPKAAAKKKKRRRSNSVESEPKKRGRPAGAKNKMPTKNDAKAASKAAARAAARRPPLAPGTDSGEKQKKRDPYMIIEEDNYLCQAYVNISENPIYGNNQTGDTFWHAVCDRFNDLAMEGLEEKQLYVAENWNLSLIILFDGPKSPQRIQCSSDTSWKTPVVLWLAIKVWTKHDHSNHLLYFSNVSYNGFF